MSPCKIVFLPECSLDAPGELSHTPTFCSPKGLRLFVISKCSAGR